MFEELKTLKAVQNQLSERDSQRHSAARNQYSQAQSLLQEYNRSLDKQTLKEAMLLLTGCVRLARGFAEPYLLLSYIYLALKLPHLSLKYLRIAQNIGTPNPLLKKIQLALQTGFIAPSERTSKSNPAWQIQNLQELDYDALYEEMQGLISTEIRAAMEIELPIGPTANPDVLNHLHRAGHSLSGTLELIQNQLDLIEQEIDCGELRIKLRMLESRLRILAQLLENSEQFVAVQERMNELNQRVLTEMLSL
jgi:hypothetical protein